MDTDLRPQGIQNLCLSVSILWLIPVFLRLLRLFAAISCLAKHFVDIKPRHSYNQLCLAKLIVPREVQPVTLESIRATHRERRVAIRARLAEFAAVWAANSDELLFEELVFCIFTAGASARMGLRSVEAARPLLRAGTHEQLTQVLLGRHRYPAARAGYIVATREFLQADCGLRLRERLDSFADPIARRDWVARTKGVKGLGYKEASHFLRNIGLRGYGILDKHILRCLHEVGVLESPLPPANRTRYLDVEARLKQFAQEQRIDFDELDLVLWSMKTGEILK